MRLRGARTGKRAVVARASRADRPHEAVRPRGLVRRPRGGARVERVGQVALPAAPRARRDGPRRPLGHVTTTGASSSPSRTTGRAHARRARRAGLVRPDPSAPGVRRADAARHSCTGAMSAAAGLPRDAASSALDRYGLVAQARADASRRCRAGSRRGSRSCCSSCRARRCCCSTSRPTTSTSPRPRRLRTRCAIRGHRARRDARPVVRAIVRPVPRLRRRRRGLRVGRAGVGRGAGRPGALSRVPRRLAPTPRRAVEQARSGLSSPVGRLLGSTRSSCHPSCAMSPAGDFRHGRRNAAAARASGSRARSASIAPTPGANLNP